jgi:hypothetical protein
MFFVLIFSFYFDFIFLIFLSASLFLVIFEIHKNLQLNTKYFYHFPDSILNWKHEKYLTYLL